MTKSGQLWGGRFTAGPDAGFAEFNRSFLFDRRLFAVDVRSSIAHANGLGRAGVLSADEVESIVSELDSILKLADFDGSDAEDVHSFIEGKLIDALGETGRKLHAGRSRNDQVATALRLWLRDEIDKIAALIVTFQRSLIDLANRHQDAALPGYTHLQRAQPILFAHWCLAYFEMLGRDRERLADSRKRLNVMPLGSGALAGIGFDIDREAVAAELGFDSVSANTLDAVSDRDFAVEFVSACSLTMVHLSRLAEDLIIYNSTEFGFITLSDAVASGSSLMPQKKNPDALELIRGKAGRVFGHNVSLLTMLKGMPLAYNKDMQEDKEALFDTVDTVSSCLNVTAVVLDNISLDEERCRLAASTGYLNATELANYLVRRGVAFRVAHEAVGKLVLLGIKTGRELNDLSLDEMRSIATEIDEDVFTSLKLDATLASKSAIGGTSPGRVAAALREAAASLTT